MDYITKFYKNRAEDLYEQVIALENRLKMITEAMTGSYPTTRRPVNPVARVNYMGDAQQEFAARSAEAGGEYQLDRTGYLQSSYNPDYTQGGVPARQAAAPLPTDMVSRAFSVPGSVAPMNINPASLSGPEGTRLTALRPADQTPAGRKDLEQRAMGTGKYVQDVAAERAAGAASIAPKAPAPAPAQQAAASPASAPSWIPNSLFAVPPSAAKYAPTSTSVSASRNPAIGAAVKPGEVSIDPNRNAVQNQVLPAAKAPLAPPAAKVVIPQNTVVPGFQKPNKPTPEVSPKPAAPEPARYRGPLTTSGRETGIGPGKTAMQSGSTWDEVARRSISKNPQLANAKLVRRGKKVYAQTANGEIELSTGSMETSHYAENAPTREELNRELNRARK